MRKQIVLIIIPVLFLSGCFVHSTPVTPFVTNLTDLNTEYDDYNPYAPEDIKETFHIIYSTNRGSLGSNFDIWEGEIKLNQRGLNVNVRSKAIRQFYSEFNSDYDEYGPILFNPWFSYINNSNAQSSVFFVERIFSMYDPDSYLIFLFASNRNTTDFDIVYSEYNFQTNTWQPLSLFKSNSPLNDLYPAICDNSIYFCSDREGVFNIYRINGPDIKTILQEEAEVENCSVLNSSSNDKCPYIYTGFFNERIMVFSSDRTGGKGGYDIYYSIYNGKTNTWAKPHSIGTEINTEYNEFRPTIYNAFTLAPFHRVLIFSSDRSGGKGGYDLYISIFDDLPFNEVY